QSRRSNDFQGVQHPGSQPIEPNKQQPVEAAESHSLGGTAPQNVELMPENEDFGYHGSSRSEQPDQGVPDQPAKIAHRANYRPIRGRQSLFWVCGRDSPVAPTQLQTVRRASQGDIELMSEKEVLHLKPALRLEQVGDKRADQLEKGKHRVG